uniref:Uncharacterized protein n=1 Tax=viral metagenome TaxID=1070528 RepID=A0A6C0BQ81_9ZZZZ
MSAPYQDIHTFYRRFNPTYFYGTRVPPVLQVCDLEPGYTQANSWVLQNALFRTDKLQSACSPCLVFDKACPNQMPEGFWDWAPEYCSQR